MPGPAILTILTCWWWETWAGGRRCIPPGLTQDEQYTHISLWCLLSAPLLIGCDMTKMDDFTLSLLTNDEVLDVDQDPLGRQAARVAQEGPLQVWAKDMQDGSKAVGLFNTGELSSPVAVQWSDLGVSGKQTVRDLWRQKDLGEFRGGIQRDRREPRRGAGEDQRRQIVRKCNRILARVHTVNPPFRPSPAGNGKPCCFAVSIAGPGRTMPARLRLDAASRLAHRPSFLPES